MLLPGRRDERHPADGHHVVLALAQGLQALLARLVQLVHQEELGLRLQLRQLAPALGQRHGPGKGREMELHEEWKREES